MTKTLKRLAFSVILNSFVRPLLPQTLNSLFVYQRIHRLFYQKVAALLKFLTPLTHCFINNWNCSIAFTTLYRSVLSTFSFLLIYSASTDCMTSLLKTGVQEFSCQHEQNLKTDRSASEKVGVYAKTCFAIFP